MGQLRYFGEAGSFFGFGIGIGLVCLLSAKKNLLTTALKCLIMPYWLSKA